MSSHLSLSKAQKSFSQTSSPLLIAHYQWHMILYANNTILKPHTNTKTGFISTSWHITSNGMFAGSCIAVILLVILLEFLRRTAKEYDRYIIRQFQRAQSYAYSTSPSSPPNKTTATASSSSLDGTGKRTTLVGAKFRPNVMQQAIRAGLHMLQFTVAYFIMLLAMYYNGYFIICIIIGAFIGAFIFSWETIDMGYVI
jgi:copper transporter 1